MNEQRIQPTGLSLRERIASVPVILWGLLILLVLLGFVSPNSVKPEHLLDFTRQAAPLIVVGIGQTIVMMVGGLDLSVMSNMILIDVIAVHLMNNMPERAVPVALLCVAIGAVIGALNGVMCAILRMPSFVVTLGMGTLLTGAAMLYTGGAPKGSAADNFRFWGTGFVGGIPAAAIVWVAFAAIVLFVMCFLPIGRKIISTGVNHRSAYVAGIHYIRVQMLCYILCGVFAAIAGLQIAAYIGTGTLALGDDYQMRSISVALLGGAAFSGGKGSVVGTVIAALFIVVMYSFVAVLNMDAGDQSIIQGVIILAGLLLNQVKDKN